MSSQRADYHTSTYNHETEGEHTRAINNWYSDTEGAQQMAKSACEAGQLRVRCKEDSQYETRLHWIQHGPTIETLTLWCHKYIKNDNTDGSSVHRGTIIRTWFKYSVIGKQDAINYPNCCMRLFPLTIASQEAGFNQINVKPVNYLDYWQMFLVNVKRPPCPLLMYFHHRVFKFLICDLTETLAHVASERAHFASQTAAGHE